MTPDQQQEHYRHSFDLDILRKSIDAGEGRDGSLMFFQLPDVLPAWRPHPPKDEPAQVEPELKPSPGKQKPTTDDTKTKRKKPKPIDFPPPEGLLGTLNIHKSGRVTCDWGGVRCEVSVGSHADVLQEATHIDPASNKAVVLGSVGHRLVLTPDLDALLRREKHDRKLQAQADAIKLEVEPANSSSVAGKAVV